MSDVDWEAVKKAQGGDTSGDKRPIKTVMESHLYYFAHSDAEIRKDSADRKPHEEKE